MQVLPDVGGLNCENILELLLLDAEDLGLLLVVLNFLSDISDQVLRVVSMLAHLRATYLEIGQLHF